MSSFRREYGYFAVIIHTRFTRSLAQALLAILPVQDLPRWHRCFLLIECFRSPRPKAPTIYIYICIYHADEEELIILENMNIVPTNPWRGTPSPCYSLRISLRPRDSETSKLEALNHPYPLSISGRTRTASPKDLALQVAVGSDQRRIQNRLAGFRARDDKTLIAAGGV